MEYLNVALPKGRIGDIASQMFIDNGVKGLDNLNKSRKLVLVDEVKKMKFFLVKPSDVPTYVEYGAADIGIVGKDILMEESKNLYEVLDLGLGKCRIVIAGPKELEGNFDNVLNKRIATKFPKIAREYFEHKKNESIEIIKLNGSVELAPLVGLSECIVDIVETGTTLKEHGLVVLETIAHVSARLVVNRVSYKMKNREISKIIEDFKLSMTKK